LARTYLLSFVALFGSADSGKSTLFFCENKKRLPVLAVSAVEICERITREVERLLTILRAKSPCGRIDTTEVFRCLYQ